MQLDDARRLQEWRRGIPCDHPDIEIESDRGADTGGLVCSTCGKTFTSREEWREGPDANTT